MLALKGNVFKPFAGTVPFKSESILGLYKEICESPLQFPDEIVVSSALKHLLSRMLDKDPQQRMGLQDVMQHPWATYNGMLPLLDPVSHRCFNFVCSECMLPSSCRVLVRQTVCLMLNCNWHMQYALSKGLWAISALERFAHYAIYQVAQISLCALLLSRLLFV